MYPEREIVVFHAETSLHAGAGASIGYIDNPLQRERATGNPIIQANGVKGALREFFDETHDGTDKDKKIKAVFGTEDGNDGAGAVAFGEARILFFPVRSLQGIFSYIICPSIINRLQRDLVACNKSSLSVGKEENKREWEPCLNPGNYQAHSNSIVDISNHKILVLEEHSFSKDTEGIDNCLETLANMLFPPVLEYKPFKENFPKRVAILNDSDYAYFVKYATEVEPHNRIDDNKGTVDENGVWYTEYLPSESILYAPLFIGKPRIQNGVFSDEKEVKKFISGVNEYRIWLGGDRTTGKGRVMMHLYGSGIVPSEREVRT